MEVIREIRDINSDQIIIKVPQNFRKKRVEILVLPLEKLEKAETTQENSEEKKLTSNSGLCGIWKDERTSEEIINDIYSHRTGFGNRPVAL